MGAGKGMLDRIMGGLVRRSPWWERATDEDLYQCYRVLLRREPDPEGWELWTGTLRTRRLSGRELWRAFLRTEEFQAVDAQWRTAATARFRCVTRDGLRIYVDSRDELIGACLVAGLPYEPEVAAALGRLLRPGMRLLDLGANVGYFTLLGASLVSAQGQVVAFEPNPDNVALLRLGVRDNGFTNVVVHAIALAEGAGSFALYTDRRSSLSYAVEATREVPGRRPTHVVPALALDAFLGDLGPVDVVKIDVDGNELRVLSGMRGLVARDRPVLVIEFAPRDLAAVGNVEPEPPLEELVRLGYELFVLDGAAALGRGPLAVAAIVAEQAASGSTHLNLIAVPNSRQGSIPGAGNGMIEGQRAEGVRHQKGTA